MKNSRVIYSAICSIFITTIACGQRVAPPPPDSKATITKEEIGYHARWLASDELEGRGTGTKANNISAEYLAREFKRYSLKPAGENGTYLQTFDVVTGVELKKSNSLVLIDKKGKTSFLLKKDFIPFSFSESGTAIGGVVFAGYGISAPQSKYDDYEGIDVKNKIVLILAGNPDENNPKSELAGFSKPRSKAMFARNAGASGLLIVNTDSEELYKLRYDNSPSTSGLPTLNINKALADRILSLSGSTLKEILDRFSKEKKPHSFEISDCKIEMKSEVNLVRNKTSNVIGLLEGSDVVMEDYYFVIGAHYDHLGWGQEGSLYRGEKPMIHNGADDNASGTAGMLELAQYFSANKPRHSMLFIGFAGEEMGALGSSYWTANPTKPVDKISAMFTLDMIGRLADSTMKLNVQGIGTSPLWEPIVKKSNDSYNFDLVLIADGKGGSDNTSFYLKNIPILFFFTGLHTDYHRPTDDFETLNIPGVEKILRYISDIMRKADEQSEKIAFTRVQSDEDRRTRGYNVYVGTIPDIGSTAEGFKISGVSPGGPAEKSGMKSGDIIIQFGETTVKNIYDYMNALSLHKAGEDVPVRIKRGDEIITLTVHLEKR